MGIPNHYPHVALDAFVSHAQSCSLDHRVADMIPDAGERGAPTEGDVGSFDQRQHLPQRWPWETQFSRALARLRGPGAVAGPMRYIIDRMPFKPAITPQVSIGRSITPPPRR